MAKPDLDDGFLMIAHELFSAVMTAHMPQEARLVIVEVFSQVYGPARRRAATLSPTEIGKRTGTHASSVARGIAFGIKHGIIRREGLGAYVFVKDYESWGTPGKPLLAGNMTSYAAHAPTLAISHKFTGTPQSAPARKAKKINESVNKSAAPCGPQSPTGLTDSLRIVNGPVNPTPYRDKGEVVVAVEGEASHATPLTLTDQVSRPAPDHVAPDGNPLIWAQRPFKPDPAELLKAKELIEAIDPHQYLGQKVQYLSTLYPLEWIIQAFVRNAGKANLIANLANNTLVRWWQQGFMDEIQVLEPRPWPSRTPAPRLTPAAAKQERLRAFLKSGKAVPKNTEESA